MADNDVFARDRLIRASDLTMLEIFYLVTLNQFLGDNDHAWPSQARIAESMNAGLSSVKKWQRELQKKEIIEIDSGAGCSSQNHYKINFAKLVTRPRKASKSNGLPQRPLQAEWSTTETMNGLPDRPGMVYDVATERPLKDHRKEHSSQPALFDDDRKPKKTSPSAISIEEVVAEWNRAFGKSLRATDGRKAALKARSKDQFFRDNWRAAIERASASDFCCGGGKDKWIADVDWFLKPDSVTRLMEGKYDNKQASAKASAGTTSSLWQQVVSACVSIRLEDPGYPKQLKKQFDESVAARIMQLKVRDIKAAADSRARGNDFPLKDLEKRFNELGGVA